MLETIYSISSEPIDLLPDTNSCGPVKKRWFDLFLGIRQFENSIDKKAKYG